MTENKDNASRLKGLREDYIKTFSTEEGKRVLADLERIGFFKTTTFIPNDALSMAFQEGNRAFLLHIKTVMELDIETLERLNAGS